MRIKNVQKSLSLRKWYIHNTRLYTLRLLLFQVFHFQYFSFRLNVRIEFQQSKKQPLDIYLDVVESHTILYFQHIVSAIHY